MASSKPGVDNPLSIDNLVSSFSLSDIPAGLNVAALAAELATSSAKVSPNFSDPPARRYSDISSDEDAAKIDPDPKCNGHAQTFQAQKKAPRRRSKAAGSRGKGVTKPAVGRSPSMSSGAVAGSAALTILSSGNGSAAGTAVPVDATSSANELLSAAARHATVSRHTRETPSPECSGSPSTRFKEIEAEDGKKMLVLPKPGEFVEPMPTSAVDDRQIPKAPKQKDLAGAAKYGVSNAEITNLRNRLQHQSPSPAPPTPPPPQLPPPVKAATPEPSARGHTRRRGGGVGSCADRRRKGPGRGRCFSSSDSADTSESDSDEIPSSSYNLLSVSVNPSKIKQAYHPFSIAQRNAFSAASMNDETTPITSSHDTPPDLVDIAADMSNAEGAKVSTVNSKVIDVPADTTNSITKPGSKQQRTMSSRALRDSVTATDVPLASLLASVVTPRRAALAANKSICGENSERFKSASMTRTSTSPPSYPAPSSKSADALSFSPSEQPSSSGGAPTRKRSCSIIRSHPSPLKKSKKALSSLHSELVVETVTSDGRSARAAARLAARRLTSPSMPSRGGSTADPLLGNHDGSPLSKSDGLVSPNDIERLSDITKLDAATRADLARQQLREIYGAANKQPKRSAKKCEDSSAKVLPAAAVEADSAPKGQDRSTPKRSASGHFAKASMLKKDPKSLTKQVLYQRGIDTKNIVIGTRRRLSSAGVEPSTHIAHPSLSNSSTIIASRCTISTKKRRVSSETSRDRRRLCSSPQSVRSTRRSTGTSPVKTASSTSVELRARASRSSTGMETSSQTQALHQKAKSLITNSKKKARLSRLKNTKNSSSAGRKSVKKKHLAASPCSAADEATKPTKVSAGDMSSPSDGNTEFYTILPSIRNKAFRKQGRKAKGVSSLERAKAPDAFEALTKAATSSRGNFLLPFDVWWLADEGLLSSRERYSLQYRSIKNNVFVDARPVCDEQPDQCKCSLPSDDAKLGCLDDCVSNLAFTECSPDSCPLGARCGNQRFQRHTYPPGLKRFETSNSGYGVSTTQAIERDSFILEYVGELISTTEFKKRMLADYADSRHHYCLHVDRDILIDSYRKGNLCRFVNHSCEPNCEMQKWNVNGQYRMGLFATQRIPAGAEITYDYNFIYLDSAVRQECFCGAPSCSGFIGGKSNGSSIRRQRSVSSFASDDSNAEDDATLVQKNLVQRTLKHITTTHTNWVRRRGVFLMRNYTLMWERRKNSHPDVMKFVLSIETRECAERKKLLQLKRAAEAVERAARARERQEAFRAFLSSLKMTRCVDTRRCAQITEELRQAALVAHVMNTVLDSIYKCLRSAQPAFLVSSLKQLPSKKKCPVVSDLQSPSDLTRVRSELNSGAFSTLDAVDAKFVQLFSHLLVMCTSQGLSEDVCKQQIETVRSVYAAERASADVILNILSEETKETLRQGSEEASVSASGSDADSEQSDDEGATRTLEEESSPEVSNEISDDVVDASERVSSKVQLLPCTSTEGKLPQDEGAQPCGQSKEAATHQFDHPTETLSALELTLTQEVMQVLNESLDSLCAAELDFGSRSDEHLLPSAHVTGVITAAVQAEAPSQYRSLTDDNAAEPHDVPFFDSTRASILTAQPTVRNSEGLPDFDVDTLDLETGDIMRCPCGSLCNDGVTIQCDKCLHWQHCDCVSIADPELVDDYVCCFCKDSCYLSDIPMKEPPNESDEQVNESLTYHYALRASADSNLQLRIGDCVYLKREWWYKRPSSDGEDEDGRVRFIMHKAHRDACSIFRIERLWTNESGERSMFGFFYLWPHETFHEPTRKFYVHEVVQSPLCEIWSCTEAIGKCCVMDAQSYRLGRPRDVLDERHVYVTEFKTDKVARAFSKMVKPRWRTRQQPGAFRKFSSKWTPRRIYSPHPLLTELQKCPELYEEYMLQLQNTPARNNATTNSLTATASSSYSDGSISSTCDQSGEEPGPSSVVETSKALANVGDDLEVRISRPLSKARTVTLSPCRAHSKPSPTAIPINAAAPAAASPVRTEPRSMRARLRNQLRRKSATESRNRLINVLARFGCRPCTAEPQPEFNKDTLNFNKNSNNVALERVLSVDVGMDGSAVPNGRVHLGNGSIRKRKLLSPAKRSATGQRPSLAKAAKRALQFNASMSKRSLAGQSAASITSAPPQAASKIAQCTHDDVAEVLEGIVVQCGTFGCFNATESTDLSNAMEPSSDPAEGTTMKMNTIDDDCDYTQSTPVRASSPTTITESGSCDHVNAFFPSFEAPDLKFKNDTSGLTFGDAEDMKRPTVASSDDVGDDLKTVAIRRTPHSLQVDAPERVVHIKECKQLFGDITMKALTGDCRAADDSATTFPDNEIESFKHKATDESLPQVVSEVKQQVYPESKPLAHVKISLVDPAYDTQSESDTDTTLKSSLPSTEENYGKPKLAKQDTFFGDIDAQISDSLHSVHDLKSQLELSDLAPDAAATFGEVFPSPSTSVVVDRAAAADTDDGFSDDDVAPHQADGAHERTQFLEEVTFGELAGGSASTDSDEEVPCSAPPRKPPIYSDLITVVKTEPDCKESSRGKTFESDTLFKSEDLSKI